MFEQEERRYHLTEILKSKSRPGAAGALERSNIVILSQQVSNCRSQQRKASWASTYYPVRPLVDLKAFEYRFNMGGHGVLLRCKPDLFTNERTNVDDSQTPLRKEEGKLYAS